MTLALDTETTGMDFWHGARPYLVTTCDDAGNVRWWEWDVDPVTRQPSIPPEDVTEIKTLLGIVHSWGRIGDPEIEERHKIVGQNIRFDVTALSFVGIDGWPWSMTHDTLIASHLLSSNTPHNLTNLAVQYLGKDIQPFEDRLQDATEKARRICRAEHHDWQIAKRGRPDMPSAKERCWKLDTWLPRAVAKRQRLADDHPWWRVASEYANADSAITVMLWQTMREELHRRGLWAIYQESMRVVPRARDIEVRGVTASRAKQRRLLAVFGKASADAADECVGIAAQQGCDLTMPKGAANNRSLLMFCFGEPDQGHAPLFPKLKRPWLALPPVGFTDSGNPSLDAEALETWIDTLPEGAGLRFVTALAGKRKRDKAISDMESYERFWVPWKDARFSDPKLQSLEHADWRVLHPNLNQTGTDTLRFSSNNPNSQNASKKKDFSLRSLFGPAPGREWWSFDYQNIELRIPAFEAGEQTLIDVFLRPDDSPYFGSYHLIVFDILHPQKFAEHGKRVKDENVFGATWYQWVKNGNFARQYGCQEAKADQTYRVPGAFRKLNARMPRIAALNDKYVALARRHGFVETIPDRTVDPRHGYPIRCSRSESGDVLPTVPLCYHVSGTAMWCTRKAMCRVGEQLEAWHAADPSFDGFVTLQVHDELVLDFPKQGDAANPGNLPKIRKIRQLMEQSGDDIGIPLTVSVELHEEDWGEGRSF